MSGTDVAEVVHGHGIVAFCGTDAVCRCDFRWRSVADYEVHLADVVRAYGDLRAAEELEVLAFRLVSIDVAEGAVFDEIGALRADLTAREEAER